MSDFSILCWNVRGLNLQARRDAVRVMISTTTCHLACLQETKLSTVDRSIVTALGGPKLNKFSFKPAEGISGTRGGILLLWDSDLLELSNFTIGEFHISANVSLKDRCASFYLTVVYGPSCRGRKPDFLREMSAQRPPSPSPWLVLGDFNCTYKASDKNNSRVNPRLMLLFRQALDICDLKEIPLQNRKFTWSNERRHPTLVRLDRFFCNSEWEEMFGIFGLHALSSSVSDHCPLLLSNTTMPRRPRSFRFENFWTKLPGYQHTVEQAWLAPTQHREPFHRLYYKLQFTAKALKEWSSKLIPDARLFMYMALEVILRLDMAQENRGLSDMEVNLRNRLKMRILGYAVIERARNRQNSRMLWLKFGDANTKFFHRTAGSRRRKNFIQRLRSGNGWVFSHNEKAQELQNFFHNALKRPTPRSVDLNWDIISDQQFDLSSLDAPFSEEEIKRSIDLLPGDKAPGPDGFTGVFLKSCWTIIRHDIMATVNALYNNRCLNLQLINSANIILIPKKEGAEAAGDFRPISLIHSFIKIITKTLALRLALRMNELVSPCQSAFIQKRSIHENFLAVRSTLDASSVSIRPRYSSS